MDGRGCSEMFVVMGAVNNGGDEKCCIIVFVKNGNFPRNLVKYCKAIVMQHLLVLVSRLLAFMGVIVSNKRDEM